MTLPPDAPPRQPRLKLTLDPAELPVAATALGVGLLWAAVVTSGVYSRQRHDLDWSNFVMGVLATLGLLAVAAAAHLLLPEGERGGALVSWPGATGALAAGLMLAVLIDKDKASAYVGSLVVIALSVLGYLAVQAWPFVVTAIAGLAVLYARGFDDLFDVNGDGDNTFMTIGAAILVFVVAVTVAGWLLPATRTVAAMVVGVAGLAALVAVFEALIVFRSVAFAFSAPEDASDFGSFRKAMHHSPYTNDVYAVLAYCAVLAALWVGCSLATGHVGFRILVVADAVTMIPLATFALMTRHPTWWEVVAAGAGGLVLVWAGLRLRRAPVSSPELS